MKRRWIYHHFFLVVVGLVGVILLVTVLLCCLSRAIFPRFSPALPVFALAAAVEGLCKRKCA